MLPRSYNKTCEHGNYRGEIEQEKEFPNNMSCLMLVGRGEFLPQGLSPNLITLSKWIHKSIGWLNEISFKVPSTLRSNTLSIKELELVVTNKYKQITSFSTLFHFNKIIRHMSRRPTLYNEPSEPYTEMRSGRAWFHCSLFQAWLSCNNHRIGKLLLLLPHFPHKSQGLFFPIH